jgi:hypothetical protein
MDPLRHPDLVEVSRRLRRQLVEVLAAEQEAAAVTLARRSTIRDRMLDAEDRNEVVWVDCIDGEQRSGRVDKVGADHLVLERNGKLTYLSFFHVVAIGVAEQ